ncbi:glycosyltransferase family 2 protein [Flavobacterium sp.]
MDFTLIICTYMRPAALLNLLNSVKLQTLYPSEILIIDGSTNDGSKAIFETETFKNLKYFKVDKEHRGLTRQRNFGISKISPNSEILCFLDDDTVLTPSYFEEIIRAFESDPTITGVAGIEINANKWFPKKPNQHYDKNRYYEFEDHIYPEGSRNVIRNILGLQSDLGPGKMPEFSNGRTCGYPLTGRNYEVDLLIGLSFSFRRIVFESNKFSTYFEGYGLYEDADYSIRALQFGKNIIATKAQLYHYHDEAGRPNKYQYGKMVVRNGWYVWRVKYPKPSLKAKLKWNTIILLLAFIRFTNIFTTKKKQEAFTESIGRFVGWLSLWLNKPKIES